MKKAVFAGICLCVAACGFGGGLLLSVYHADKPAILKRAPILRQIPKTADFGAYLAGLLARDNQDVAQAADYYERAYLGDMANKALKTDLYLLSGLAGKSDRFIQIAQEMTQEKKSYYAALFLAADAVGRQAYGEALSFVQSAPKSGGMSFMLTPVLRAWSLAAQQQTDEAFAALKPLHKGELSDFYWYQKALLGVYLNKIQIADDAFEQMGRTNIPSVTALLAARHFYKSQNKWRMDNSLYRVYQKTLKDNPALGEILVTRADEERPITPAFGVAEAFFIVSTLVGNENAGAETGLMFNQIALHLKPTENVYKIWGAEQFEGVEYYAEANRLYDSISNPSETILFKKALNLMLMNKNEEAEQILKGLSERMPYDMTLAVMLGNLYRETNRPALAVGQYTRALSLVEKSNKKDYTSLYFSRALVYEALGNDAARDDDLQAALALTPDDAELLNFLGYVWIDENKHIKQAMDYINRAHQLAPKEPHIWDSLAWGYYKQGDYDNALDYAERAADKMPYSALVQSHLGDIYQALGRKREAGYQYNKALHLKADMTDDLRQSLAEKLKTAL